MPDGCERPEESPSISCGVAQTGDRPPCVAQWGVSGTDQRRRAGWVRFPILTHEDELVVDEVSERAEQDEFVGDRR